MDWLIELETVDFARVIPLESLSYVSEEQPELLLVIAPDQLTCCPSPGTITGSLAAIVVAESRSVDKAITAAASIGRRKRSPV